LSTGPVLVEKPAPRAEYVLTAKDRDLGPIVRAMRDWGRKYAR
jgi:DNA-binding HxlR family transcriptional regulator